MKTATSSALPEATGSPLDLPTFVENIRLFRRVLSPAHICYDWLMNSYRWNHPNTNVFMLLFFNGMWIQSATFSAFSLLLIIYGSVFVMSLKTDRLRKSIPESNPAQIRELKEIYGEFYLSILLINSIVTDLTKVIVTTYEIVRWEDPSRSIKTHAKWMFYGAVIYASFAYSFIILFNVVMLHNLPVCLGPWLHIEVFSEKAVADDSKGDLTLSEQPPSSNFTVAGEADVVNSESKPSQPLEQSGESATNADQSSAQFCRGCDTSFGYFLNRRHYCRHCGDHFCANCCNQYVPRYLFGATAPAAKTEKVMVCFRCFEYLSEKFEKETSVEEVNVTEVEPSIN